MLPKPAHLGPAYAGQFQDRSVVAAYHHRPLFPAETFDIFEALIADVPRVVLDVGCGTGEIARPLAERVERVDAVDWSAGMIERGKRLPGGADPRLTWIVAKAEEAPLRPPYALVTAGNSLHWLDWAVVMPRFRAALTPNGVLAVAGQGPAEGEPWAAALLDLIGRASTNRDFQPYDLIAELTGRGFFHELGRRRTAPVPFAQSVDDYIEMRHSQNGLSRDRMGPAAAAAFDAAVRALVTPYSRDGLLHMDIAADVVWGEPGLAGA